MTREMLNRLAEDKKINLNEYEYYYGQVIKGYIHIFLCVRCAVGVATPLTMKTIKIRCSAINDKNGRGEIDYNAWDFESEGRYIYIPTMK